MGIKVRCLICEVEQHVSLSRSRGYRTCSKDCMQKLKSINSFCKCDVCKTEFKRKPSEQGKHNFCSKKCFEVHRNMVTNSPEIRLNKFVKRTWGNLQLRCANGRNKHLGHPGKCKAYENIYIELSRDEFKEFCHKHIDTFLSLERPSLDRIDSTKNYSLDNIRLIELADNIRMKNSGNKYSLEVYKEKRGVRKGAYGHYYARICIGGKERHLGAFTEKEDAYNAFRQAYIQHHERNPW